MVLKTEKMVAKQHRLALVEIGGTLMLKMNCCL
jgi:hypothetical protein